jgi:uncharacterized membrane protein
VFYDLSFFGVSNILSLGMLDLLLGRLFYFVILKALLTFLLKLLSNSFLFNRPFSQHIFNLASMNLSNSLKIVCLSFSF